MENNVVTRDDDGDADNECARQLAAWGMSPRQTRVHGILFIVDINNTL